MPLSPEGERQEQPQSSGELAVVPVRPRRGSDRASAVCWRGRVRRTGTDSRPARSARGRSKNDVPLQKRPPEEVTGGDPLMETECGRASEPGPYVLGVGTSDPAAWPRGGARAAKGGDARGCAVRSRSLGAPQRDPQSASLVERRSERSSWIRSRTEVGAVFLERHRGLAKPVQTRGARRDRSESLLGPHAAASRWPRRSPSWRRSGRRRRTPLES